MMWRWRIEFDLVTGKPIKEEVYYVDEKGQEIVISKEAALELVKGLSSLLGKKESSEGPIMETNKIRSIPNKVEPSKGDLDWLTPLDEDLEIRSR
uniref:Uncharacterized protein n=1 Tax=Dictyoglomus turgidum TaxID=513050 RepID=A0A7C3SQR7_9BACT